MKGIKFLAISTVLYCCIVALPAGCVNDKKEVLFACDTSNVKYSITIKPILDAKCNTCHYAGNGSIGGGTVLDNYLDITNWTDTTGGNPGLWNVCTANYSSTGPNRMPKGTTPLSDCEINKIYAWIYAGAPNN